MAMEANEERHFATFVELLTQRAKTQGDQVVFTFLDHRGEKGETLTYNQLHRGALRVAAVLRGHLQKPVLLLYPPGSELIIALFGCFYAGAIAVPARPPHPNRLHRADPRLAAVVNDARATLVLSTATIAAAEARAVSPENPLHGLASEVVDHRQEQLLSTNVLPPVNAQMPALIQYTSGSTATPRGVIVSHGNLMVNQQMITEWLGTTRADRIVSWLPPYHDMGLIGSILHPVYLGARCWLMAPVDFARKPTSWLQAVSRYHATVSGAPDFAYALVAQRVNPKEKAKLDLNRWRVAFNGAEPIRRQTMETFAETFAECGFRKSALTACYGLAEATLFVCGADKNQDPAYMTLDPAMLERHQVAPPQASESGRLFVSCGKPTSQLRIVAVSTGRTCPPNQVGEIWLSGGMVAQGYHHRPGESSDTFGLSQREPMLRTGDLGFLKDGQLFITGREKELIIIRGRNHYPQDIEWTVETALASHAVGQGAAFGITLADQEQLVILWEMPTREEVDSKVVIDVIREAVVQEHGIMPFEVLLIECGSLPLTTSGKIKRRRCKAMYQQCQLEVHHLSDLPSIPQLASQLYSDLARTLAAVPTDAHRLHLLTDYLCQLVGRSLELDPSVLTAESSLSSLALDSLSALELVHQIESDLGCLIPVTALLAGISIADCAKLVLEQWQGDGPLVAPLPGSSSLGRHPLSYGQHAIWKRTSTRGADNIAFAAALPDKPNLPALKKALEVLHQRHEILRTVLGFHEGEAYQQVLPSSEFKLEEVDASGWSREKLREHLADEAHHPLGDGPFWRILLFLKNREGPVLLWVADPVALDLWSLALLVHELGETYHTFCHNRQLPPAEQQIAYSDFVHWQEDMLAGLEGERLWRYWKKVLTPRPAPLMLPTDRARHQLSTKRAANFDFALPPKLVWELECMARTREVTLFTVLMAGWHFLLHRYSGQEDIVVGTLSSARDRVALAKLVGPLANSLPIRANLNGNPRFCEFLERIKQQTLAAQAHQDFPYALMLERLADEDNSPSSSLFQVMLLYQSRPPLGDAGLSGFALGGQESTLNLHGLELTSISFEQRTSLQELSLTIVETRGGDGYGASLEYRADLFDEATIRRLSAHYINLLEGMCEDPELHADEWHLLSREERELFLVHTKPRRIRRRRSSLHQLFHKQVIRQPTAVAVAFQECTWTFSQLEENANRLAHYLLQLGIQAKNETPVGLCCDRSPELVAAVLAVLKVGGLLVPLPIRERPEQIAAHAREAGCKLVLTRDYLQHLLPEPTQKQVYLDFSQEPLRQQPTTPLEVAVHAQSLAYLRHQKGRRTGRWIHISHGNLTQLPAALAAHLEMLQPEADKPVWCAAATLTDAGGIAELLLPLALGLKLVLVDPEPQAFDAQPSQLSYPEQSLAFSLACGADSSGEAATSLRDCLPQLCAFADRHQFEALWMLDGGRTQANPLVWATLAAAHTQATTLRYAGLQPCEAEQILVDWGLVNTLAHGRLELGMQMGEQQQITKAKKELTSLIDCNAWWLLVNPQADDFERAGSMGASILFQSNGQEIPELETWIRQYRQARREAGHQGNGHVTYQLPVHINKGGPQEKVQSAYRRWLQDQGYERATARKMAKQANAEHHPAVALIGTVKQTAKMADALKGIGVDELACEVAFGLTGTQVLAGLPMLNHLYRRLGHARKGHQDTTFAAQLTRHGTTHVHCTLSGARLLLKELTEEKPREPLHLLLSGKKPEKTLIEGLTQLEGVTVSFLQGTSETSTAALIQRLESPYQINRLGYPIAHTQVYVLDDKLNPLPPGVTGSLAVAGEGVCRGYCRDPRLTAQRFVPNPFGNEVGTRLFLTSQGVCHQADGSLCWSPPAQPNGDAPGKSL